MGKSKIALVVLSSGSSIRFNQDKLSLILTNGQTVLNQAVTSFVSIPNLTNIVVVCSSDNLNKYKNNLKDIVSENKNISFSFIEGGESRCESAFCALKSLDSIKPDLVVIHDGARPFVSKTLIDNIVNKAMTEGSAVPYILPSDAVKILSQDGLINSLSLKNAVCIQTPQCFKYSDLLNAYKKASSEQLLKNFRDDSDVFIWAYNKNVQLVKGDVENKKLTNPSDLKIRIGEGEDIHNLKTGGKGFNIGGVFFPSVYSLEAHGDGDSLLHSLADCLLGALGKGDIGDYFPPTDNSIKGIASKEIIQKILQILPKFRVINISATVQIDEVRLTGKKEEIEENIANLLSCSRENISVKAKSFENPSGQKQYRAIVWGAFYIL